MGSQDDGVVRSSHTAGMSDYAEVRSCWLVNCDDGL